MKRLVIRQAVDDFGAFKIGDHALRLGGEVVSVTVNPLTEWDHAQGYPKPVPGGKLVWIVWMTFDEAFNPDVLDAAIDEEERRKDVPHP